MKQLFNLMRALVAVTIVTLCASAAASEPVIAPGALRIDRVTILGVAARGERLAAVGERGAIFLSDDQGASWRGVRTPTTRTLTSVLPLDDGWLLAGHGGVLMRVAADGGQGALIETDAGVDSFLGLIALGGRNLLAYGGFGLMLRSEDGGQTWDRQTVVDADFDRHISAIIPLPDRLLLLGESGTIAESFDEGKSWTALQSPYQGSWFGGVTTPSGAVVIFGMRGNVFRSEDGGTNWTKVELPTVASFFGAMEHDGRVVLTGGGGLIAISNDDGRSFRLERVAVADLAGAYELDGRRVAIYGRAGVQSIEIKHEKK